MHFDFHLRREVFSQLDKLAQEMAAWEAQPDITQEEKELIRTAIVPFEHTTQRADLVVSGVDGSGDYPTLSYADSFVYLSTAVATTYRADPVCGLREINPHPSPQIDFVWLPEDETQRRTSLDTAFVRMAGSSLEDIIKKSDYLQMRRGGQSVNDAIEHLIRPHASDRGNLAIQLRSTAELSAGLRQIELLPKGAYLLIDGTFSLPFIGRTDVSLFHEHVKRLCCVRARERGVYFMALSKSHGLPGIEILKNLARERRTLERQQTAEHWYLRVPTKDHDGWQMTLVGNRRIPPIGAVTYLVRLHKNVPLLRIDLDQIFWSEYIQGSTEVETQTNERKLFEDLDYASHDQRCFGYPYPIKAAHDRVSMTQAERAIMRKQVIDAAVRAGMKPSLFRDASRATGHG